MLGQGGPLPIQPHTDPADDKPWISIRLAIGQVATAIC